jgi:hypothetical protein
LQPAVIRGVIEFRHDCRLRELLSGAAPKPVLF